MSGILFIRKRCLVVDCGGTTVKVLLAERHRDGIQVLHSMTVNLREEGLLSVDEMGRHLARLLDAFGDIPMTALVRQSSTISQIMEMGGKWPHNVRRAIREETSNLSGLSERSILYDFVPMRPFARFQAPYWVTIARENELEEQIEPLRRQDRQIAAVTTPANSLVNAFVTLCPGTGEALLLEIGETSTTVALVEGGQGVFATNIALGGEHFTEALAEDLGVDYDRAESIKREADVFESNRPTEKLGQALLRWREEIDEVVMEWSREQGLDVNRYLYLPCWLSGGGSCQPGLHRFLALNWHREIGDWPALSEDLPDGGAANYAVAYGAALGTFRKGPCPVNLLPADLRKARGFERRVQALYWVCAVCLALAFFLIFRGAGNLREDISVKREELERAREAVSLAEEVDTLRELRREVYFETMPVLYRKKVTRDFLETLAFLRGLGEQEEYWFVLLADEDSYFEEGERLISPRSTSETIGLADFIGRERGFIVELCVPGEEELAETSALGEVVSALRSAEFLRGVDKLPAGQRRVRVPPEATLPDYTYTLTLELEPLHHGIEELSQEDWRRSTRLFSNP